MKDILLTTINAKWIHPSLALRLLKANLGSLEDSCEIIEFALRQPLAEKLEPFSAACAGEGSGGCLPKILGVSVSIWNHLAVIELLNELEIIWKDKKPVIVLGGPEVTHLPPDSGIFRHADHVIRGEGETAFRMLCEKILHKEICAKQSKEEGIKSAYHLYTDEDTAKKLIYVESSRGCPFKCEFCLSSLDNKIYEFPLEPFLAEMEILINRGVKTFKFLDRSFNVNIPRALRIIEFFLAKIKVSPFTIHFEMVPSLFSQELLDALTRFPPGTLRLEIGIQTLNPEVCVRINRPSNPEKELAALRFLRDKTNAIIHADLIAGLPGENLASFARGFNLLREAILGSSNKSSLDKSSNNSNGSSLSNCLSNSLSSNGNSFPEIQLGILKLLPGTPIARHIETFGMRFSSSPPYDVEETSSINAGDIKRIKNFARFWELIVNRGLMDISANGSIFENFLDLCDKLFNHFGRNYGIDKTELIKKLNSFSFK